MDLEFWFNYNANLMYTILVLGGRRSVDALQILPPNCRRSIFRNGHIQKKIYFYDWTYDSEKLGFLRNFMYRQFRLGVCEGIAWWSP
jgi:hypothetical protein